MWYFKEELICGFNINKIVSASKTQIFEIVRKVDAAWQEYVIINIKITLQRYDNKIITRQNAKSIETT